MTTDKNGLVRNSKNEIIGAIYTPTFRNKIANRWMLFTIRLGKLAKAASYAINR